MKFDRARLLPALPALLGLLVSLALLVHQHRSSGGIDGFPLDDPWIHLTYARTLHDHASFAYFPGEPSTAGSTSPLYTLMLALCFGLTRDEKLMSFGLGILFHVTFLLAMATWARRRLGFGLGLFATGLLAFDPRIAILALSGMETSLFLTLIALAFWGYCAERRVLVGTALGLAVWTRPDALILVAVLVLAELLAAVRERARRAWLAWLLPFAALFIAYLVFNQLIGGSAMPNTLAAKRAYYAETPSAIFLRRDLWGTFAVSSFGPTAWLVLLPFALVTIAREARRLVGRAVRDAAPEHESVRAELGFVFALPLAYFVLLPYSHRFERYLIPALLAYAIVGLRGVQHAAAWLAARVRSQRTEATPSARTPVATAILAGAALVQLVAFARVNVAYRGMVNYHHDRHERAGRWLKEHTPPDAVIATHDVGAIAFYSERKVVDMVGLIQPDAIAHLHQPDYTSFLGEFFAREKVSHLAVLRNWIEVTNVDPLFTADPRFEVLEIFAWDPARTHLMPEAASSLNRLASVELSGGNAGGAVALLRNSLEVDRESAHTWALLGAAYAAAGQRAPAEAAYREAARLQPGSRAGIRSSEHLMGESAR